MKKNLLEVNSTFVVIARGKATEAISKVEKEKQDCFAKEPARLRRSGGRLAMTMELDFCNGLQLLFF